MEKRTKAVEKFKYVDDLTLFDIDDTLLRVTAKVRVKKQDGSYSIISSQQLHSYKLQEGEQFDFSEFADADKFQRESIPVEPFASKARLLMNNVKNSPGVEAIYLTARSDSDDKNKFISCLESLGFEVNQSHIERAGNLGDGPAFENKREVTRWYVERYRPSSIRMFDDSQANLSAFLSLKSEFPEVNFYAYKVHSNGLEEPFHPHDFNLAEDEIYKRLNTLFDVMHKGALMADKETFDAIMCLLEKGKNTQNIVESKNQEQKITL